MQVVSAREYQAHLETQSYRTIRLPAVRGKILDREGRVLAENRPRYNLSLYLDDLRDQFDAAYGELLKYARAAQKQNIAAAEKKLGRSLTKTERRQFGFQVGTACGNAGDRRAPGWPAPWWRRSARKWASR